MAEVLRFDVLGRGDASDLERLAAAVDRITDELRRLDRTRANPRVDVDTERAEREVGAFARNMQRTIRRAVESLPDIELDADAGDAHRELARIRAELAELSDKHIGIDIDTGAAIAKVQALERELRNLRDADIDVHLRADVATAMAQLAAVTAQVDRLDGREISIKVDPDRSLASTIIHVTALGRALSTLAIPAALALAAPQIAGIGAAAVQAAGSLALIPAAGTAAAMSISTLVVGLQGFGEAMKNLDDQEKFAEALKNLSNNARAAATTIKDLGASWTSMRLDVQDRLFEGVSQSIQRLSNAYLPVLSTNMTRVADAFNLAFRETEQFLTSATTVPRVSSALSNLERGISASAGAIKPLTDAMLTLVEVGASRMPRLGQAVTDLANRFRDWVVQAERSGDLARWIDQGIESIKQLGRIVRDVGAILHDLFAAADRAGVGFLDTLERITSRIRGYLESVEGSQRVEAVFRAIGDAVEAAWPGVEALGRAIGAMLQYLSDTGTLAAFGQAFSAVAQAAAPLLGVLSALATTVLPPLLSALSALAPVLVPVAAGLIAVRTAAAGLEILRSAGTHVQGFVTQLRGVETGAGKFRTVLSGLAGFLGVGGPWGIALAAAAAGMSALIASWGRGEAEAAAAKRRIDSLTESLNKYSGAATEATRAQIAQEVGSKKLSDGTTTLAAALHQAGVSTRDFVDATTGNEQALAKVRSQLDAHVRSMIQASSAWQREGEFLRLHGIALEDLAAAAQGSAPAMDRINEAIARTVQFAPEMLGVLQGAVNDILEAGGASAEAARELNRMADEYHQAAEAAREAGQANLVFADVLDVVRVGLEGLARGGSQTEKMRKALTDLGTAAEQAAEQAGRVGAEMGGVELGAAKAQQSMQESRNAFIEAALAAGMSAEQAEALADSIGLIPELARINFETNASETGEQINHVALLFDKIPGTKQVTVQALTDDARAQLEALGLRVEQLRDGTFRVTADTEAARAALDAFVAGARSRSAEININGNTMPAQSALAAILQAIQNGEGTVSINGNSMPAQAALAFVLGLINGTEGSVTINGQAVPAQQVLQGLIASINSGSGTVTINGNTVPANEALSALIGAVTGSTPAIQVDANTQPASHKVQETVTFTNGQKGTITVDANNQPADGKIRATVSFADGSTGTITIDGNENPARGKITATVRYADGSTGTLTINANDANARAAIERLKQPTSSTHTINVVVRQAVMAASGPFGVALAGAIGRAEGGIVAPMHAGGIVGFAGGGVAGRRLTPMRGGVATIVPPNTWRVIGDRMTGREAYIPLVPSRRNVAILSEAASALGFGLVPTRRMAFGGVNWPDTQQSINVFRGVAAAPGWADIRDELRTMIELLRGRLGVQITVNDASGDPVETARATALALRMAR